MGEQGVADDIDADVAAIARIDAVPALLEVVCRTTGMGFAVVARVTEDRWVACAVRDELRFGLKPGGELQIATTICHEVHASGRPVVIDDVAADEAFRGHPIPAMYGFKSYISMPIFRPGGAFFGTLCALDPRPARLSRPETVGMFRLFAELIGFHLEAVERLEASERAARERLDFALDAAGAGAWDWAGSTGRIACSRQVRDLLGLDPSTGDPTPAALLRLAHPADALHARAAVLDGQGAAFRHEFRIAHPARGPRWISAIGRVERGPDGRPVRGSGIVIDVTARKEAEAALRESEERFRWAIEEAPIPVMMWAETGELLAMSRTVTDITGYTPAELASREDWLERAYGGRAGGVGEGIRRYFQGEAAFPESEFVVRTARGEDRIWRFRGASPEHLAGGRRYSVAFAMDVTERKQAEAALRQAKEAAERANAAKSRFLAAASHDLRQPLQALDLQRAVLARRVTGHEALQTVQELGLSIDVMRDTLDALLDLSQLETGAIKAEVGEFALDDLFRRIAGEFRGLAAAKGLELRVVATSAVVRSDPRLLERIVQNLVANAVKYTQAGKVLLGGRRRGERLRIVVKDTGIGIAQDQLDVIFEEFYQVANTARERRFGLGLGLSIAHAAAKLLDGKLDVRSALGRGSSFALEVPFLRRAAARPLLPGEREPAGATAPAATILLVEDDGPIREALRSLLELEGHRVAAAASGREALAMVRRGACRPAMAILDQNLPGGLTGVQTVRRLRSLAGPRLPALVITGDVLPDHLAAIRQAALPYLTKPVKAEELRVLMRSLIGGASAAPATAAPVPAERAADDAPAVHVIEDDALQARSLGSLLAAGGYGTTTHPSAEAFLQAYHPGAVGCLVVDVHLPGMDGLELQRELARRGGSPPCVFVTGRGELGQVVQAMREGAADFLVKPVGGEALLGSVARALDHGRRPAQAAGSGETARLGRLTDRERRVVELVAAGLPNKEIAHRLGISQRTVEGHRGRAMHKLDVRTAAELVRLLIASGHDLRSGD